MLLHEQTDRVQYSCRFLDWTDEAVDGRKDGRNSFSDVEALFERLAFDSHYSDLEKHVIKYIRENLKQGLFSLEKCFVLEMLWEQ